LQEKGGKAKGGKSVGKGPVKPKPSRKHTKGGGKARYLRAMKTLKKPAPARRGTSGGPPYWKGSQCRSRGKKKSVPHGGVR